jgi:hypothetical protein
MAARRVLSPHAPTMRLGHHLFPNTMEAALHRNSSGPAWAPLRLCRKIERPTRGRQRQLKIPRPARAQPTRAQCDWASFISKHDGQRTEIPLAAWAPSCAANRASTREGRIARKLRGLARAQPRTYRDWASFIAKHDGGSATQKFPGRRGAPFLRRSANRRPTRRKGRSKLYGPARVGPRTRPMRLGIIYSKHDGGRATQKFLWSGGGSSSLAHAVNRSNARRQRRSKIHAARRGPQHRAHTMRLRTFISKHRWSSAGQKPSGLAPPWRTCAQLGATNHEAAKGRLTINRRVSVCTRQCD